jgi:hypothetical protein
MDRSTQKRVAASLGALGLPIPPNIIQTMLMHDGYFVGWKVRCDGGDAILHSGDGAVEFYDDQGRSLRTITLESQQDKAA